MDVMFLVLVFFIYSIFDMAVHRGLRVDLPAAAGSAEPDERIVITLRPDDTFQFNGIEVTRPEILARIDTLRREKVTLPVLIAGDRKASLGAGVELLAALKSAGVADVAFQVSGEPPVAE